VQVDSGEPDGFRNSRWIQKGNLFTVNGSERFSSSTHTVQTP
jgi:hypothetical protein